MAVKSNEFNWKVGRSLAAGRTRGREIGARQHRRTGRIEIGFKRIGMDEFPLRCERMNQERSYVPQAIRRLFTRHAVSAILHVRNFHRQAVIALDAEGIGHIEKNAVANIAFWQCRVFIQYGHAAADDCRALRRFRFRRRGGSAGNHRLGFGSMRQTYLNDG